MSTEIVFVVEDAAEGGYSAHAASASIFVEADDLAELHVRLWDPIDCHFAADAAQQSIRLHFTA